MSAEPDEAGELFLALVELPPDRRAELLARRCEGREPLRREVEALLAADAEAGDFLEPVDLGLPEAPRRAWLEGRTVGQYQVERVIGMGGMGTVYAAWQRAPRRLVALKLLRAGFDADALRRRFVQEAEILGRLRHRGIAEIYEAATYDSELGPLPYFALEYIPHARSITAWADDAGIDRCGRVAAMVEVCRAVAHAHERGVLHRDLKPSNILVGDDGRPKLIDFGVARLLDGSARGATLGTGIGELVGTLQYMSPEQCAADGRELDVRTDVHALGVIAYELVAGALPYPLQGLAPALVAARIRSHEPAPPTAVAGPRWRALDAVILTALAKQPAHRHASATAMADELERALRGEPVRSRRSARVHALRRAVWRARRAVPATLATGGIALALAGRGPHDAAESGDEPSTLGPAPIGDAADDYAHQIAVAERALAGNDLARAKLALGRCAPAARGWEWHRLLALVDGSAHLLALGSPVRRLVLDGAQQWLYAVTEDGRVHGLRRRAGERLAFESGWQVETGDDLDAIAIDDAGGRVFVGGDRRRVHVIAADGRDAGSFADGPSTVVALAFAPTRGELLVTRQDGSFERWDVERRTQVFATRLARRLAPLVLDGDTVWAATERGVVQLAWADARVLDERDDAQGPEAVAVSDGQILTAGWRRHVVAHAADRTARTWPDLADGVLDLCALDRRRIAVAGRDGRVTLWQRAEGVLERTLRGHDFAVEALACSDQGWLASGSADGTVRLWWSDAPPTELAPLADDKLHALAWRADGRVLFAGGGPQWGRADDDVLLALGADGRVIARARDHLATIDAVASSPDGAWVASADRRGDLVLRASPQLDVQWRRAAHDGGVAALAFADDAARVASVGVDGTIALWAVRDGEALARVDAGVGELRDVAWRGPRIVAVGQGGLARWQPGGGTPQRDTVDHGLVAIAALGADAWAVGRDDGTLVALTDDGARRWQAPTFGRAVVDVAVTPDGRRIAVAGWDAKIRLHDAATGELLLTVGSHETRATAVAFAPDGHSLASAGFDRRVRLWRAP